MVHDQAIPDADGRRDLASVDPELLGLRVVAVYAFRDAQGRAWREIVFDDGLRVQMIQAGPWLLLT